MQDVKIEKVNLKSLEERGEVSRFLETFDLILDHDVDYTIVARGTDGEISATCSKAGKVLKCFAVEKSLRGENITSKLVTALIDKLFSEGIYHFFVFTKSEMTVIFTSLNFKLIYEANSTALLEYGITGIKDTIKQMKKQYQINSDIPKTALVMNCNPFTLGHRYLIERAAASSKEVLIFMVSEDSQAFPFDVRYKLAVEGTSDLKNVKLIKAGEYIISYATFPTYFIKDKDIRLKTYEFIDSGIFAKYFCHEFNIVERYIGTEPFSKVTKSYNEVLKQVLPKYNIKITEIERKTLQGLFISASRVREFIKCGEIEAVKTIVPKSTWDFLNSSRGKEICEAIRHE
jgi:[citrate (pro-3S)-lyase] ligase